MNMIQPLARAICASEGEDPEGNWEKYAPGAKAALEYLRDNLASVHHDAMQCDCGCKCSTEDQWKAAINSALA